MKSLPIAFFGVLGVLCAATPEPTFAPGKSVYVVGIDSRNLAAASADLEVQRKAKDQFKSDKRFKLAPTLNSADFVFVVLIDRVGANSDEIAVAILPDAYRQFSGNIDAMRENALWQSDSHFKRGRHAALAGATLGWSAFFDHPSVARDLVKQFHKDLN